MKNWKWWEIRMWEGGGGKSVSWNNAPAQYLVSSLIFGDITKYSWSFHFLQYLITRYIPKAFCYFTKNTFKSTKTPFKISHFTITLILFSTFTKTPFIAIHANTSQTHWYTILYPSSKMKITPWLSWPLSYSFHHQQIQTMATICLFLYKQQTWQQSWNRILLSSLWTIQSPSVYVLDCQHHWCQYFSTQFLVHSTVDYCEFVFWQHKSFLR